MNTLPKQDAATPPPDSTTRLIPLTKGQFAIVDAADFDRLMQWKWHAQRSKHKWYARRGSSIKGKRFGMQMHRFILGAPPHLQVDHIDGNSLNNSRRNLRLATNTQNQHNRILNRNSTSGCKGVGWTHHAWQAQIHVAGRKVYLGRYTNKQDAVAAYVEAAKKLHGEFFRKS